VISEIIADICRTAASLYRRPYSGDHPIFTGQEEAKISLSFEGGSKVFRSRTHCNILIVFGRICGIGHGEIGQARAVTDRYIARGAALATARYRMMVRVSFNRVRARVSFSVQLVTHYKVFFRKSLSKVTCERNFQE